MYKNFVQIMYVYHVYVWCLWGPKESILEPGNGVMDDCESLFMC